MCARTNICVQVHTLIHTNRLCITSCFFPSVYYIIILFDSFSWSGNADFVQNNRVFTKQWHTSGQVSFVCVCAYAIVTSVHNLHANDKRVQKVRDSVPVRIQFVEEIVFASNHFHTNDKHVPLPRALEPRTRIFARTAKRCRNSVCKEWNHNRCERMRWAMVLFCLYKYISSWAANY